LSRQELQVHKALVPLSVQGVHGLLSTLEQFEQLMFGTNRTHGLHTLQGRWPALMASSRVLKLCRFAGEILCAHLQSGL
jgi:hypothetical protein